MSFARALRAAALCALAVAGGSCTTRETGTIDLIPSASPPKPPKKPPACAVDDDCPGDPKHRFCRIDDGNCVECLTSDDCAGRPEPLCDDKGNCVPCRPGEPPCADSGGAPEMPPS